MSENAVTHCELAVILHSVPHLGPRGIARLLNEIGEASSNRKVELEDLRIWKVTVDTLQREYKLHPEAARSIATDKKRLLSTGRKFAHTAEKLGIQIITILDADYPSMLREYEPQPPPIIYAYGSLDLLRERKFSVISSAKISAHGMEVIQGLTGILADKGLMLVTSHNTHPYQAADMAARSRNVPVILVLDRGILSVFPHGPGFEPAAGARMWDFQFDPDRDLVLSRFRLHDNWIGANGRERDRMVFALSDVVVGVEIRPGGVMEAECLRAHGKGREVYIYASDGDDLPSGNRSLLDKGIAPVTASSAHSFFTTLDVFHKPVGGLFEDEITDAQ